MKSEFSTFDIGKILNIPRERLKDWMNNGFVKPAIKAQGKGTKAIFNTENLYEIALFQKMITLGFNRKNAAEFIFEGRYEGRFEGIDFIFFRVKGDTIRPFLLAKGSKSIDLIHGIVDGIGGLKFKDEPDHHLSFLDDWDFFSAINFKKLKVEVDKKIKMATRDS